MCETTARRSTRALAFLVAASLGAWACGAGEEGYYLATAGDTGVLIARHLEIPYEELKRLNRGRDLDALRPGDRVRIPRLGSTRRGEPMGSYVVAPGDTGLRIAQRLEVPFRELVHANPGTPWHRLGVGSTLRYPLTAAGTGHETVEVRAKRPAAEGAAAQGAAAGYSSLLVRYQGQQLASINPRIVGAQQLPLLDFLAAHGHLVVGARGRDCASAAGKRPLAVAGFATARDTVALDAAESERLGRALTEDSFSRPDFTVVFCHG